MRARRIAAIAWWAVAALSAIGLAATLSMRLPASADPAYSLTVQKAAASRYGLSVGLVWWSIGIALALGYFVCVYRSFRGKVSLEDGASY